MEELKNLTTGEEKGEMIVFAGAKGGVGKTVIAVNTAVALANKGFSTCIIDGSFQFGDVNLALDIQPKFTITDVAQDIKTLTSSILSNYLQEHESGVRVLSAPLKPEYADLVTGTVIEVVCEKILEQYNYLIVDLSSGLSENNIAFMELAHSILIVTDLEMAALKNTKTMLKTLGLLGMEDKIRVVINRGDMDSVIKPKDVPSILEKEVLFLISNDFKIVSKSFNIGIPFVMSKPREKISLEIGNLAGELCKDKYLPKRRKRKKQGLLELFKR